MRTIQMNTIVFILSHRQEYYKFNANFLELSLAIFCCAEFSLLSNFPFSCERGSNLIEIRRSVSFKPPLMCCIYCTLFALISTMEIVFTLSLWRQQPLLFPWKTIFREILKEKNIHLFRFVLFFFSRVISFRMKHNSTLIFEAQ